MQKARPKQRRPRIANPVRFYTFVAVIILIIAAVLAIALYKSPVNSLTGTSMFVLHRNESLLLKVQNNTVALYLANSNSSGIMLYLGPMPFGLAGYGKITLHLNNSVNVSSSLGKIADMNIRLVYSNASAAKLYITPIAAYLDIKSSAIALLGPTPVSSSKGLQLIVTTSTSTTSSTTSTINYTAQLLSEAIRYANTNTSIGILMNAYKQLYIKDKVCNESIYNETFYRYYNTMPSGLQTFSNMSKIVPIDINETASQLYGDLVYVNYTPVLRNGTMHEPMVSMLLNLTHNAQMPILQVKFEGLLFGDNYTLLNNTYQFQSRITNYCGAYIEPP